MPDNNESAKKRSRSPSDAEPSSNKRANTGQNTNDPASSRSNNSDKIKSEDVKMIDAKNGDKDKTDAASPEAAAASTPSANIHMRCLIVTQDASIIIGKGGSHVNEIREKSGAKVMVSESIPGNPERILNVSGALDAVSKACCLHVFGCDSFTHRILQQAFGLIVRRINDEPFDVPSVPGSRAVTIKFIIPNSRMGSVIGKGGSKIKEIQDASGARLNASEGMLPGSTEVCSFLSTVDPFLIFVLLHSACSKCFWSCRCNPYCHLLCW
jgi:heterogeneous nuclear rnp K-like protein